MAPDNRFRKAFYWLTASIFAIDALFVYVNYRNDRDTLQESLATAGEQSRSAYESAYQSMTGTMLKLATYIANDPRVIDLFTQGHASVQREGGGNGGPESERIRQALYEYLAPSWGAMSEQFGIRQLHFHIGAAETSFLRVHSRGKFGDSLADVRHTIVDAVRLNKPITGFESGRVYAGIRGVLPLSAPVEDARAGQVLGALETGISFDLLLQDLIKVTGDRYAIVLSTDHMAETMWPDFLQGEFKKKPPVGAYFVESTNHPRIEAILRSGVLSGVERMSTQVVTLDGEPYSVTAFPLRDYRGEIDPARPSSGLVVTWRGIGKEMAGFQRSSLTNVIYGVVAFLLVESMIYGAIRATSRRLQKIIDEQTADLQDVNAQLQEKNKLLDGFAHTVAHDLRNPIAAIMGYSKLCSANPEKGIDIQTLATRIHAQADRMNRILGAFLAYARAGRGEIQMQPLVLSQVINEAVEQMDAVYKQRGTQISVDVSPVVLHGNSDLLVQVFANLISNSVKYCAPEKTPHIAITAPPPAEGRITLEFSDNGIGIPADELSKIFDEFSRVHARSFSAEGTGIGLATVRRIVRAHGGEIAVKSQPGEGTTMFVVLPVSEKIPARESAETA